MRPLHRLLLPKTGVAPPPILIPRPSRLGCRQYLGRLVLPPQVRNTLSVAKPDAEVVVSETLVRGLLKSQHPDLAELPLGERFEGWDNVSQRLGKQLLVRLPRRTLGAELGVTERTWLPRLARSWSFPAPIPERYGHPSADYPYEWSVVRWIEGQTVFKEPLSAAGAEDIGRALAQVHQPPPADAPTNPFRSPSLEQRRERFVHRLRAQTASLRLDGARALYLFDQGAAQMPGIQVLSHLDLHGNNVLSRSGRLAGLLDWGDLGRAQVETDLGQVASLVAAESFPRLLQAYLDAGGIAERGEGGALAEPSLLRITAEALYYALLLTDAGAEYAVAGSRTLRQLAVVT